MATQQRARVFSTKDKKNSAWVIARDRGICGICGHTGADSLGHILPVATHPELEHDPANWQAEHLATRTLAADGYDCIGNRAKRDRVTNQPPSRDW